MIARMPDCSVFQFADGIRYFQSSLVMSHHNDFGNVFSGNITNVLSGGSSQLAFRSANTKNDKKSGKKQLTYRHLTIY